MKPTFFDLFSGCGGFRLAFERLGWTCTGYCELDKWALKTYRANFPCDAEFFWSDATTMPVGEVPDFDVLCSGFPCQPWSMAGRKRGFDDARGTLFFEIARLLEAKRPKAFLLENVDGLTFEPMLSSFRRMLQILDGLGYAVFWKILNSLNFGVAQNRERVFIVGFRHAGFLDRSFPWPSGSMRRGKLEDILEPDPPEKYRLSERLVRSLTARMHRHGNGLLDPDAWAGAIASSDGKIHARNLLVIDPDNLNQASRVSPSEHMRTLGTRWGLGVAINATNPHNRKEARVYHRSDTVRTLKADRSGTNEPLVLQVKKYHANGDHLVREYEGISPTLTGQMGTGGHNVPMIIRAPSQVESSGVRMVREDVPGLKSGKFASYDNYVAANTTLRRLTPRECLRLMGFPESYRIVVSDAQLYREAGNSVVVPVVEAIGREIEKWLA